jgi:hypothetical protein
MCQEHTTLTTPFVSCALIIFWEHWFLSCSICLLNTKASLFIMFFCLWPVVQSIFWTYTVTNISWHCKHYWNLNRTFAEGNETVFSDSSSRNGALCMQWSSCYSEGLPPQCSQHFYWGNVPLHPTHTHQTVSAVVPYTASRSCACLVF